MLTIVRSPLPSIQSEPQSLPAPLLDLCRQLEQRPQRFQWIVPTGRRLRDLLRNWLRSEERKASLLPGLHTIKSFAAQLLQYSARQLPQISGPQRLLRVARAWQEVMGRAPGGGLVRQLDRFLRDWQACNLDVPTKPADIFEHLIERYSSDLRADLRLDHYSALRLLVSEITEPNSWPNRFLQDRVELVLFDGFHRLERLEVELIAALSRRCQVWAWLVGVPGQLSWSVLESTVKRLVNRGCNPQVIDHVPVSACALTRLGRRLFPAESVRFTRSDPVPGLFRLEAANATLEVEAVAKRIKADCLASGTTHQPALFPGWDENRVKPIRLSDIAVVIPGPDYDPLIREIFPRTGLEFNLAGQALRVSGSRPARVLSGALQLVYGHWRHDLLYDFLSLPLIKRCLAEAHRLHQLFEHRPRARRQLDYQAWEETWRRHLQKIHSRIERWESGELELPEHTLLTQEEFVARQRELADSLERLIESIKSILQPVAAIARLADGAVALDDLVSPCVDLLRLINIDQWLTPRRQPREVTEGQYGVAIPWVEYEKDQKAYYQLLGILRTLPTVPPNRLPLTPHGRVDVLGALQLALDSETYQIKTEDDAGVQIFELRELRGLRFRHVYVTGLADGQIPQITEEGLLAGRRRLIPALAEQLQQKEIETAYLFAQLFEVAEERLVLSCPSLDADERMKPSRFLRAVEEQVAPVPLEPAELAVSMREATIQLGRTATEGDNETTRQRDNETTRDKEIARWLEEVAAGLADWRKRQARPGRIRIEAEPLLQMLFPDARIFNPSELETYAACPFRYFGSRVLKLEEWDPDRTRWYYGSLVHRVLQAFYGEMRQLSGTRDSEPLPAVDGRHRARLIELFEAEWDQLDDGTLPPDLKSLFACEQGVVDLFCAAIAAIEAEHGNLLNEFVLEDSNGKSVLLGNDEQDRPVLLTGKIDRVDIHRAERARAIILDYKTGRSKSAKEREEKAKDGRMLQLALYAAALARVRSDLQIVGGAYVHLSEKLADAKKAIAAAGEVGGAASSSACVPFDAEAARRLALRLVGEIRQGKFSLTGHTPGQPYAECTWYCDMKHACRHPDGYETCERY